MSENQYGAQGDPISVSREPEPAPPTDAPAGEEVTLAAPDAPADDAVTLRREDEPTTPSTPEEVERTLDEMLVDAERRAQIAEESLAEAKALVVRWDDKAATIPLKGDYQKGARLATVECSDDLRRALHI